jgi:hypothetical protein
MQLWGVDGSRVQVDAHFHLPLGRSGAVPVATAA